MNTLIAYSSLSVKLGGASRVFLGARQATVTLQGQDYKIPTRLIWPIRDDAFAVAEAARKYAYTHA